MAKQQLVVFISNTLWRGIRFQDGVWAEVREFPADVDNQVLLSNWLIQFPKAAIYFLTDLVDEQYHVELLPPVAGRARKHLLARRLAAWPFAQGLHAVHKIDSVENKRREDRYLFSAIHYPPLLDWLQVLQQQAMRVQGVYTQALCLPCWLSILKPEHTRCLYVHIDKHHTRICYFYRARLLFNRVLKLPKEDSFASRIASEVAQTRLHLIHQQWLQEDEPVHVLWLSDEAHMSVVPETQQLPKQVKQTYLSYDDLHRQLGWEAPPTALNVIEWAAVQVAMHTRQLPNLAPETALLSERVFRAKRRIMLASALMMALFIVAGWLCQQAIQQTRFNIQQTRASMHLWQSASPELEFSSQDLPRLQTFTQAVRELEGSVRYPDRILKVLQHAMADQAVWRFKRIEWQYGPPKDPFADLGSTWSENAVITFATIDAANSLQADREWRLIMQALQSASELAVLEEVNTPEAQDSSQLHGDTRQQGQSRHQHIIRIQLRPLKETGV